MNAVHLTEQTRIDLLQRFVAEADKVLRRSEQTNRRRVTLPCRL